MTNAVKDVAWGLSRWRLWSLLAWEDFRGRYHRTLLGPIWLTLSFLAFIWVKFFVFERLSGGDPDYFVGHLTLGFMVWTFLANAVNGGASAFVGSRNWILGVKAPYSIFVMQSAVSGLINLFFVALAAMALTALYLPIDPATLPVALGGLALVVFSLFWVQLLLAVLSVFVRDMVQLVSTAMRIAFFLTPIIFLPTALGKRASVVEYNPFTHYIAVVRAPILDGQATLTNYAVVGIITLVTILLSLIALSWAEKRIAQRV